MNESGKLVRGGQVGLEVGGADKANFYDSYLLPYGKKEMSLLAKHYSLRYTVGLNNCTYGQLLSRELWKISADICLIASDLAELKRYEVLLWSRNFCEEMKEDQSHDAPTLQTRSIKDSDERTWYFCDSWVQRILRSTALAGGSSTARSFPWFDASWSESPYKKCHFN
nr:hypothetical protein HmN_000960800 [Hymenolepis microstoma]